MVRLHLAPFGEFELARLEGFEAVFRGALEMPMSKFIEYSLHFQDFSCLCFSNFLVMTAVTKQGPVTLFKQVKTY
jgi:hypothetical protein